MVADIARKTVVRFTHIRRTGTQINVHSTRQTEHVALARNRDTNSRNTSPDMPAGNRTVQPSGKLSSKPPDNAGVEGSNRINDGAADCICGDVAGCDRLYCRCHQPKVGSGSL